MTMQWYERMAAGVESWAWSRRGKWRKYHLVHELARIHGYRSLLEISTSRTAASYPHFRRSRFDVCRRLSYLTPDDWSDGAPVDYRTPDIETAECIRQIRADGLSFDIVFIDAWHEYDIARRDLNDALDLVNEGGLVLAHDCLPESAAVSTPFRGDLYEWCGVSYKLYVDFMIERDDLWYCTIDTDCGCGVVRSNRQTPLYRRGIDAEESCVRAWRNVGDDYAEAYRVYERHKADLMNVVTVDEFLAAERKSRSAYKSPGGM